MSGIPSILDIEPSSGRQGTSPTCKAFGRGLSGVQSVEFSGAGLHVRIIAGSAAVLEFIVIIAVDAPPGPRELLLGSARTATGVLFHVLSLTGYANDGGIGSHLI